RLDERTIAGIIGCSEAQNRGVPRRQAVGQFKSRQRQRYAKQMYAQSGDDRSVGRRWVEWLGVRQQQLSVSVRRICTSDGVRCVQIETEVGLRFSDRRDLELTADSRCRASFCWKRQRIYLFAGCCDRMRLLVV